MNSSVPPSSSLSRIAPAPSVGPDLADGTYANPILFADFSDPDAIRVGDDYWLTASSFSHVPGLPILHSRDLVTWTVVNYALPRLRPTGHFSVPRHGGGVWAPSLRHHAGRFWIFFPDPDFGLYAITATDPTGAWTEPVLVKEGAGLIDPCPFWDDDGTGYLVHGWAKSRAGVNNRLTLHRLRTDNRGVIDGGVVVVDGDALGGAWHTIEGPKLYKRNGYYYLFAPAGGVREGYQAVFRSRSIQGPYENRIVLAQGATEINGPHQGAWVDTPAGASWFLHFQERAAFGRVVHLQPMTWRDDWPVIGRAVKTETGEPVGRFPRPLPAVNATGRPAPCDRFVSVLPGLEWQWQANPAEEWFSCAGRGLPWHLRCMPLPSAGSLWSAGHLLLRKFVGPAFHVAAEIEFRPTADGDRIGLLVFGHDYAWIGLIQENGRLRLTLRVCVGASANGTERETVSEPAAESSVTLCVAVDPVGRCQFGVRSGGSGLRAIGPIFPAKSGIWVGAKAGLFAGASGADDGSAGGSAVVHRFALETVPSAPAGGSIC